MSAIKKQPAESDGGAEVDDCIKVALALVKSNQGIESFVEIGKATLAHHNPNISSDMQQLVEYFINQVGNKTLGGIRVRESSERLADAWFEPDFESKHANGGRLHARGTMHIQSRSVTVMHNTKELRPHSELHDQVYDRFIFNMGLAIARGLVHCFFYMLVDRKVTPSLGRRDIADVWEKATFGGRLLNEDDLKKEPAGCPAERLHLCSALELEQPDKSRRWIVLPENLRANIPDVFPLPLKTSRTSPYPAKSAAGGGVAGSSSGGYAASSTSSSTGRGVLPNTPRGPALGGPPAPVHKPAATKPAATKPAATKPAATKPASIKPASIKPKTPTSGNKRPGVSGC